MHFYLALVALLPTFAMAIPTGVTVQLERRQGGVADTCGSKSYTSAQVNQAIKNALSGSYSSSGYPHKYNNYEDFDFSQYCDGPYAEYPLTTKSGGYTGGSPGADRVIYDTNDYTFCGAITHTGASGNDFVGCKY